jgi:hypothetical protein
MPHHIMLTRRERALPEGLLSTYSRAIVNWWSIQQRLNFSRSIYVQPFKRLEGCFLSPEEASQSRSKPFFHLAIDECSKMGSHLSVIQRLWGMIGEPSCCLLLLDTTTQISLTDPRENQGSGFRMYLGRKPLLSPFINLPHDLGLRQDMLAYGKVMSGQEYLSHAGLAPWLRKMGRPLLNDNGLLQPSTEQVDLMKLLGKMMPGSPEESFNHIQSAIALALHRMSPILVGFQGEQDHFIGFIGTRFLTLRLSYLWQQTLPTHTPSLASNLRKTR